MELKGLYGVAYSCSDKNVGYCDDWYVKKYESVYRNNINKSLKCVKQLGFNHIRTYYLKPEENHDDFLQHCSNLNMTIEIGISNNLLDNRDYSAIKKLVLSTKNHKCVKLYLVGNEYFGDVSNIVFGLELVYSLDNSKYLISSSIFDNNFHSAKKIINSLEANKSTCINKYIVSLNTYFYNNPPHSHGDVIQNVVKDFYNDSILKNQYLVISEFGNNYTNGDEQWQSLWNFSFGNVECLKNYKKYLGYCLFSFSNESWKGSNGREDNYGILTENGDKKNGYYAVLEFRNNNAFKQFIRQT